MHTVADPGFPILFGKRFCRNRMNLKEIGFRGACTLTALFTKLRYSLLLYRMTSGGRSCWQPPLTANGHFSVPQELF